MSITAATYEKSNYNVSEHEMKDALTESWGGAFTIVDLSHDEPQRQ